MRLRAVLVIAPLLLIGAVAAAVYTLRIDQIRVTGLRNLSPRTVIEESGLKPGDRILWIRLSRAARKVESIPAVAEAVTERSLPQTVVINVRERVALAALDRARDLAVDVEGRMFARNPAVEVPSIEGWRGRARAGSSVDRVSRSVLEAFNAFPPALRSNTAVIVVGPPLVLKLRDGTEVRFGRLEDLQDKAVAAVAVLEAERGTSLEYIDVRSPSVPVVRSRPPPTPVPTPRRTRAPQPPVATAPPPSTAVPQTSPSP
jgi:cell division protein FtsQ